MTIKIHDKMEQGSDEWHAARRKILTASEMKLVVIPTLKIANNDKVKAHVYEIAAQRITDYTEPSYINDDMLRGMENEIIMRELYEEEYAPVREVGFVTNDKHGFLMGWSPDGLVGEDGAIEGKSRRQKFQIETITTEQVPKDFVIQVYTAIEVGELEWIDYLSFHGGLPMYALRVLPDEEIQAAIVEGAKQFEDKVQETVATYEKLLASGDARLTPTERNDEEDIL